MTVSLLGLVLVLGQLQPLPPELVPFDSDEGRKLLLESTANRDFFPLSSHFLTQKTPAFWDKFVVPKINIQFEGLHKYLNEPYPDGPNEYMNHVQANIDQLRRRLNPQPTA